VPIGQERVKNGDDEILDEVVVKNGDDEFLDDVVVNPFLLKGFPIDE